MKNLFKLAFFYLFLFLNISCSQTADKEISNIDQSPEYLYELAILEIDIMSINSNKDVFFRVFFVFFLVFLCFFCVFSCFLIE